MTDNAELDRAIRQSLTQLTDPGKTDPVTSLARVTTAGRRRRRRRQGALLVVALAVAATVPVGGIVLRESLRSAPQVTPAAPAQLAGTYVATVDVPSSVGVAGLWTLTFSPDGRLLVLPPGGFRSIRTGFSYAVAGSAVRTDLFAQDLCAGQPVGTYGWDPTDSGVRFTAGTDRCAARRALLVGPVWSRQP